MCELCTISLSLHVIPTSDEVKKPSLGIYGIWHSRLGFDDMSQGVHTNTPIKEREGASGQASPEEAKDGTVGIAHSARIVEHQAEDQATQCVLGRHVQLRCLVTLAGTR